MLTRRTFGKLASMSAAYAAAGSPATPDISLEIAPYTLEASPRHRIQTIAYNGQVPGPLLRLREGREVSVSITNRSPDPEVVHWHGLFLPPAIDGAMEEGTPMIAPGATTRYSFTPSPTGFRWFHTHTFAGKDFRKAQYGGQHGFLLIDPAEDPGRHDREVFLALHDWGGHESGGDDGSMNPVYDLSTINGKMLGFNEPIRVRQGERIRLHILNSSPTEVHWLALPGHTFRVTHLDGNEVASPQSVPMLRLAPAERISADVEMNHPGLWILGEVRRHIQSAGMGIVIEYADATGKPTWVQPPALLWNYQQFGQPAPVSSADIERIPLVLEARFKGHGSQETWLINGKSYPDTDEPILHAGRRYRLVLDNRSMDDHPLHLHRHTFEVRRIDGGPEMTGVHKDVVLVPSKAIAEVEFTANHPGRTLFHCHQQNHMDRGFMMVFRYA